MMNDDHTPGWDWVCSCGYDYFGGTESYSWDLFVAHLPKPSDDEHR